MAIEIVRNYTKVPRKKAIEILTQASLLPEKFTAHRNGTFTAKYLRGRDLAFTSDIFEEKLEVADSRIVMLKRPNPKFDRGKYVTLKFTFATFSAAKVA